MLESQPRPVVSAGRGRWWSSKASQRLIKFSANLLLEFLPVEAFLVVAPAYNGTDISQSPIPFWFLLGTLVAAAGFGKYLTGSSLPRLFALTSPLLVICALLLMRISPALYGSSGHGFFDWTWVNSFGSDLANQRPPAMSLAPVLLLLAYVWWRGLLLGSDPPDYSAVMRRFKYGMIAVVAVTIASIGIQGVLRQQVAGILGFLLPAEIFAGMVDAALGRMALNQEEHRGDAHLQVNDRLWLGSALILAAIVVGFALVINLIINYQSVGSLLTLLGPSGQFVNQLLNSVVEGLAQALHFLFGWLFDLIKPVHNKPSLPSLGVPPQKKHTPVKAPPIPHIWLQIAEILLEAAAIILVVLLFLLLLRTMVIHRRPHETVLDEERESLDATSIFNAQLHAFLSGLRPSRTSSWEDPLTPGSVRYLYRAFLEAASRRGFARRSSETPDEYLARFPAISAPVDPQTGRSLEREPMEALSDSYNSARYADRQPAEGEMDTLRKQAKALLRLLER